MHKHDDGYCHDDSSSFSNTHEVKVPRYDVKLWPHIKARTLKAEVKHYVHAVAETSKVCMDVMGFEKIHVTQHGRECRHEVSAPSEIGSRLTIHLVEPLQKGSDCVLHITSFTRNSKSLTWGDFVFTQNEPIYCRSLFPCQDTPSSKSTFQIDIHLDEDSSKLNVFATGLRHADTNKFTMHIPIPTYLFAFLIGNFEHRKLNHRIGVVAEPAEIEACVKELDELETYVSTLEKLIFPYEFREYNVCILPRSFPYGGMENPIYTFASPSIITGDRSGTTVAVHEIAHSWTGNLISCRNWQNFWMNEGFTVYFENAALRVLNGEEYYNVSSIVEQKMLLKTINEFGKENSFSSLTPQIGHGNPDDAFSVVPYYKGYTFLTYLEQLVGAKPFLELLQRFLKKYSRKSVEWHQFRDEFNAYVAEHSIKLSEEVHWEEWIVKPGYPPRLDLFKSTRIDEVTELAKHIESDPEKFDTELGKLLADITPLNVRLLEVLLHLCQETPVTHETLKRIDGKFSLSTTLKNYSLMTEWFLLCLVNRFGDVIDNVEQRLLSKMGRMKFIRPIYRELKKYNRALANTLFDRNKCHYAEIANDLIAKELAKE